MIASDRPGIVVDDLSFAYPGTDEPVLRHLDWEIDDGAFVVVAGESGSGKSTLLRCLNGLIPHFSGGHFGGSVSVGGYDTRLYQTRALSRNVGIVFQEPEAQRVAGIVEDEIAFGLEQFGVPVPIMRKRVEEVLDLVGIAAIRHRDIDTLSGGERQRVAVASALAMQPRVLVLDEPTSQLDPAGAEEVVAALERLNHDLGLTIVIAEHRLERVLAPADRMRALTLGGLVDGAPRDVVRRLDDPLLPPIAQLARRLEWETVPLTVKEGRSLVRARDIRPASPPARNSPTPGKSLIRVQEIDAAFGRRSVLRRLSLDVGPGEIVALMGRNGSGKTTLLRAILGFHRPERGTVHVRGIDVARAESGQIARHVGYLPQRPSSILFNETLRAEIAFSRRYREGGAGVDEMLQRLDLAHLAGRNPRDLSVGEQERAALAAVLVGDPAVLVLDEPTRGMDGRRKAALSAYLGARANDGGATILATHDVELVAQTATRVVLLGDGEVVADGTPREVLSGSLGYTTQMNKLFGDGFLTVEDVISGLSRS